MKYNKLLINKYVGIETLKSFDLEAELKNFVNNVKIGKLYLTTEKISGCEYPPEKVFSEEADEILWAIGHKYLEKNFGLSKDEAKRKAIFTSVYANSVVMPVEILKTGELIKMLHETKVLWFSTKYILNNTVLVPLEQIQGFKHSS